MGGSFPFFYPAPPKLRCKDETRASRSNSRLCGRSAAGAGRLRKISNARFRDPVFKLCKGLTSILVRYCIHLPNTYCSKPFCHFPANLSFVLEEVNSNCLNRQKNVILLSKRLTISLQFSLFFLLGRPWPRPPGPSQLTTATKAHFPTEASRMPCRRQSPAQVPESGSGICAGSYCIREAGPTDRPPGRRPPGTATDWH